jgi:AcrR family transcriptional regulator
MKVSKEEKAKTRRQLIKAAVDIITEKGFAKATMKAIAREAGVGDATIYNYFPSKEKLLYGYFEDGHKATIGSLRDIEGFNTFTLQEQLQTYLESGLERMTGDREFVREAFQLAYSSPVSSISNSMVSRRLFINAVTDMLNAAVEVEEIPEQPFQDFLPALLWDYYLGIIAYWLKDDSEDFVQTSELLDLSLGLIAHVLQSNLLTHVHGMLLFFFRNHIFNHFDNVREFAGSSINRPVKRNFMEDA